MKKCYCSLPEEKRIVFLFFLFGLSAFILSSFCFFINAYDIPLGILLGTIISVINFLILRKQTQRCFSSKKPGLYAAGYFLIRMFIYASGLVIAIVLEKYFIPLFEVFAVLGVYILSKIILIVYGTKRKGLRDG